MNVRRAKQADVLSIYNLITELEETMLDIKVFTSMYLDNISNSNIYYIIFEKDSKIIGFASLHIQKLLHHVSKVAEVQELVVTESYRNYGIGKIMYDELKAIAKEEGCSQIEVCCNMNRERTHIFYQKNGMSKTHYKFTNVVD